MNSKQSLLPCQVSQDLCLPMTRVKIIMKSSPGVEVISQDCLYLMTKVTEMFIKYWAKLAYGKSKRTKTLEYKHLADVVHSSKKFEFMWDVIPKKITFKQFKEMMAAKTSESMLDSSDKSNDLINNDIDRDQIDSEDEETSRSSSSASSSESEYDKNSFGRRGLSDSS